MMTINEYQQRAMASLNPELKGRDVLINSVMGPVSYTHLDVYKRQLYHHGEYLRPLGLQV